MLWINCEGSVWLSMIWINCGGSVRFAMYDWLVYSITTLDRNVIVC